MRNYKDLQVWGKAHQLTLMVYKATQAFPSEERFGLTSQMRRSCASVEIGWRDGPLRPDRLGFRCRAFISPAPGARPGFPEQYRLHTFGLGYKRSHAHVIFAFTKTETCSCRLGFQAKS